MFGKQNINGISVPEKAAPRGGRRRAVSTPGPKKRMFESGHRGLVATRDVFANQGSERPAPERHGRTKEIWLSRPMPRPRDTDRGGKVHGRRPRVFFCPRCLNDQTIGLESKHGQGRNRPNPGSTQSAFGDTPARVGSAFAHAWPWATPGPQPREKGIEHARAWNRSADRGPGRVFPDPEIPGRGQTKPATERRMRPRLRLLPVVGWNPGGGLRHSSIP